MLLEAERLFPWDDRFQKGPERLDFYVSTMLDPKIGLEDAVRALKGDPYAPDILNGAIWFALRAGEAAPAAAAMKTLMATEPGFVPPYLKVVPAP